MAHAGPTGVLGWRSLAVGAAAIGLAGTGIVAALAGLGVIRCPLAARADGDPPAPAPGSEHAARDSIGAALAGGFAEIEPIARVREPKLGELSGLCRTGGAWYAHNDSGDAPVVYRSLSLDFAQCEVLPLEGASAVDWEDMTAWGGDILVGDIGDNGRRRDDCTLYRARYHAAGAAGAPGAPAAPGASAAGTGRLELLAAYPLRYPDGPHDAEALFVLDGVPHLVTKCRGEPRTYVFRFDALRARSELPPGTVNVPVLVGELDVGVGEQVTAADLHASSGPLALLTYAQVLLYPRDRLAGAPATEVLLGALQCEALAFHDARLVIANEQREVYAIDRFLERAERGALAGLVPRRERARLPSRELPAEVDGRGGAWRDDGARLPLAGLGGDEEVRFVLARGQLHVAARLRPAVEVVPSAEGRRGTGLAILVGHGDARRLGLDPRERRLFLGCDGDGTARLFTLELGATGLAIRPAPPELGLVVGRFTQDAVELEVRLDAARLLGDPPPERFRLGVFGLAVHAEDDEPRFGGRTVYDLFRPFLWGEVEIAR